MLKLVANCMVNTCTDCGLKFKISEREHRFCIENSIPLPSQCPIDRLRYTSAFLSSHYLYRATCAYSNKEILTFIPPQTGYKVYDVDIWMSDRWDPLAYGQEYDFSRPFFEQYAQLQKKVPFPSMECLRSTMQNSDYTNGCGYVKNCYLLFGAMEAEDCYFSYFVVSSKNITDCVYAIKSELCYGCSYVTNCYNCRFVEDSANCSDCSFLLNCKGLKNCYGCTNLSNKEYYFYNQPLSKEDYQNKIATIDLGSFAILEQEKARFAQEKAKSIRPFLQGNSNEDSTGNYISHTKNCDSCFFSTDIEDVEWSIGLINKATDCFQCNGFGNNASAIYYSAGCGENALDVKFSLNCFSNVRHLEYCMFTGYGSEHCFGCTGLRKKHYCILNKQYTKDEYFSLVGRIKEQMCKDGEYGQFFPQNLSHLYYNESWAQDLFPCNEIEAKQKNYRWHEQALHEPSDQAPIPDHIDDVQDSIVHIDLWCSRSHKKYRILKQELAIYRAMKLPIPRQAPIERISALSKLFIINAPQKTNCSNCKLEIASVYASTNLQKILCEACFHKITN